MNLADWLLEAIAADEKLARRAHDENPQATWAAERGYDGAWAMDLHSEHPDSDSCGVGAELRMPREMAKHISRWDPARVLAECGSKRRIVEAYREAVVWYDTRPSVEAGEVTGLETAVKCLAQPYRDREGFRPEWDVQ